MCLTYVIFHCIVVVVYSVCTNYRNATSDLIGCVVDVFAKVLTVNLLTQWLTLPQVMSHWFSDIVSKWINIISLLG